MRTFATPNQKRVPEKEISKLIFGVFTEGASRTGKTQKETERKTISSLKRLITVQEASTEKNTIYREALISLEIRSVRDKLRNL